MVLGIKGKEEIGTESSPGVPYYVGALVVACVVSLFFFFFFFFYYFFFFFVFSLDIIVRHIFSLFSPANQTIIYFQIMS